jgi:hypothetical protein
MVVASSVALLHGEMSTGLPNDERALTLSLFLPAIDSSSCLYSHGYGLDNDGVGGRSDSRGVEIGFS